MRFWFSNFDTNVSLTQVFSALVFLFVFGVIIVAVIKGISQWNKNNHSPKLTVPATVVSKRTNMSHSHHRTGMHHGHHHGTGMYHVGSHTYYYVTFQVESGDRIELHVAGHEFGVLIEGDHGMLTFQGTRYLGFKRM